MPSEHMRYYPEREIIHSAGGDRASEGVFIEIGFA